MVVEAQAVSEAGHPLCYPGLVPIRLEHFNDPDFDPFL